MARAPVLKISAGSCSWRDESGHNQNYLYRSAFFNEICSGTAPRRKPTGWVPPTPYSMNSKFVAYISGTLECDLGPTGFPPPDPARYNQKYSGYLDASGIISTEDCCNAAMFETETTGPSGLLNTSLIKALGELKDQKINLGVAWGERQLTAKLLGDTVTRLAKSVRSLKRGKWKQAAQHLGLRTPPRKPRGSNITSEWLALQYGWKPLLSDVYGAVAALDKRNMSDWRVTAKGRAKASGTGKASYQPVANSVTPGFSATARYEAKALTRIDAIPKNEAKISLASLGVTNPLLVAWELVPFSFVVDWALPIGDWLSSLDSYYGYTTPWVSQSLIRRGWWDISGVSKSFSMGRSSNAGFGGSKSTVILSRSVNNAYVLPPHPSFKNPVSLTHMANALSLLAQVFSGGVSDVVRR